MNPFERNKSAVDPTETGGNKGTGELGEEVAANFMIPTATGFWSATSAARGVRLISSPGIRGTKVWSLSR